MRISGRTYRRDSREDRAKRRGTLFLCAITAACFAATVWLDAAIRPVVENIVEHEAQVQASRIVNEAVIEQMERDDISYDRLVKLSRGEDGEVVSIEADIVQINRLKSRMGNSIIKGLSESVNREVRIPAGTLIGNHFTSGRGPEVVIKTIPTGYVQSVIHNRFSEAGINQTLHQIVLDVKVQMVAVLPGYSVKTETVTSVCIAETVIVGKIPQGYAAIGGDAPVFATIKE